MKPTLSSILSDYNPHIHGRKPSTRVELLAWQHKYSTCYAVRSAAAAILVASRCLHFHATSPYTADEPRAMRCALRRQRIANAAWKLREALPRPIDTRHLLQPDTDEASERMERSAEGRIVQPKYVNFKG